jgi:hypothetical protein
MGERQEDFREPERLLAVEENSDGLHRRPPPPGASPHQEASHEARPQRAPASLPVHPQMVPAPRVGGVPSPSDVPSPDDHEDARRTADVVRAPSKRGRGRRAQKWVVRVTAIDPQTHPEYLRNSRHPFADMKPEDRLEDLITFCARLWARTCEDMAREVAETQRRAKAA